MRQVWVVSGIGEEGMEKKMETTRLLAVSEFYDTRLSR